MIQTDVAVGSVSRICVGTMLFMRCVMILVGTNVFAAGQQIQQSC